MSTTIQQRNGKAVTIYGATARKAKHYEISYQLVVMYEKGKWAKYVFTNITKREDFIKKYAVGRPYKRINKKLK